MTNPRRFRLLTDEELALWRRVAATIAPIPGSSIPAPSRPAMPPQPPQASPAANMAKTRAYPTPAYAPALVVARPMVPPLAPMERQYRKKVARGRVGIDRVMDLHGLTQAQAHGALRTFLRDAQTERLRLVLIVTGKGERAATEPGGGVLRRAVPHWLREPDLRGIVLGFEEASLPHGGAGALYVRLRLPRG